MIHVYRATRYPDRDYFTFQADEDTYRQFRYRFPVNIRETARGFEGGYFTWLRDDYRDTFFDLVRSYLRENYSPPEIRLSAFRGTARLSELWPPPLWQQKATDAVKAVFAEQGYAVDEDEEAGLVQVIPEKPTFARDNVEVYRCVCFRITVSDDRCPIIWCQERFHTFIGGGTASLGQIAQAHGEGSAVSQAIRHYTTRSADEQFELLKRFVSRIPSLSACEDIAFDPEPASAGETGLETWFWPHDSEACFEASNGLRTILAKAMLEEGSGFYSQPDDIQVIILLPIPDSTPPVPVVAWDDVTSRAVRFLEQTLPDVETPVHLANYPIEGDLEPTLHEAEEVINEHADRRVLCLIATPDREARFSTDPKLQAAENQSFQLQKRLRGLFRGGYTITLGWGKLASERDMPFVINNALIGGLYRLNAQPWKLSNLPFDSGSADTIYFLGLVADLDTITVSGTLFDHEGTLVAFGGLYEIDDPGDGIQELIESLLGDGIHHSRPRPAHVIVHTSPEMAAYADRIHTVLDALSISNDLIIIDSGEGPRLWQPANRQGTPSHGIAVGSELQNVAYLMNTLSLAEKTGRGYIYPDPNTVTVRKLTGSTSIKTLAAHVYWLSVAHVHALHRTIKVPVTIAYAQALCEHVRKAKRSMYVTRNYRKTLFWL